MTVCVFLGLRPIGPAKSRSLELRPVKSRGPLGLRRPRHSLRPRRLLLTHEQQWKPPKNITRYQREHPLLGHNKKIQFILSLFTNL